MARCVPSSDVPFDMHVAGNPAANAAMDGITAQDYLGEAAHNNAGSKAPMIRGGDTARYNRCLGRPLSTVDHNLQNMPCLVVFAGLILL